MKAEVVVVTYRSTLSAKDRLMGIIKACEAVASVGLAVVDNSEDSCDAEVIRDQWGGSGNLRVMCLPHNPGFAAACNHAAKTSTGEWLIFLNPDVAISADQLECVVANLSIAPPSVHSSAIGLVTGGMRHVGIAFNSAGWFMDRVVAGSTPRSIATRMAGGGSQLVGPSGGAGAFRTATFLEVGGFWEPMFAWGEDADLALRLRLGGFECAYQDLGLYHQGGHSVSSQRILRMKSRLLARNRILLAARLYTRPLRVVAGVFTAMMLVVRAPGLVRHGALGAAILGIADGARGARMAKSTYTGPKLGLLSGRQGPGAWTRSGQ